MPTLTTPPTEHAEAKRRHRAASARTIAMIRRPAPSFTCPVCDRTSFNPNDVEQRYCGNCHAFTEDLVPVAALR